MYFLLFSIFPFFILEVANAHSAGSHSHARRSFHVRNRDILDFDLLGGEGSSLSSTASTTTTTGDSTTIASSTSSSTTSSSASASQSCGVLGSFLGCSSSSQTSSTAPTLTPTPFDVNSLLSASSSSSSSSSDSDNCLLGLGLLCGPGSTPGPSNTPAIGSGLTTTSDSGSPTPTSTPSQCLLGVLCSPSSTPMPSQTPVSVSSQPSQNCLLPGILCSSSSSTSDTPIPTKTSDGKPPNSPTPSCDILNGFLGGCSSSSSLVPPANMPSSPTTGCGILGVLGKCEPTHTPSIHTPSISLSFLPTPTPSPSPSPSPSNPPATLTQSSSSSSVKSSPLPISFPTGGNTSSLAAATSSSSESSSTSSQTINPQYSFLTQPSLVIASTTTASLSIMNPDQPTTTFSIDSSSQSASPASAPLPLGLPARIYPGVQLDPNSDLSGYTYISILFNQELNWQFEATNPDSSNQIFAYFPSTISNALGIDQSQVKTLYLQVYEPASYKSVADVAQLGTMFMAYIPSDQVSTLAAQIKVKSSPFYTASTGIAQQLALRVNSGFALNSVADPNTKANGANSSGSSNDSNSASLKTRQDAIIGVVSALGAIALLILVLLFYRSWQRRQDLAHRRLSDSIPGARPQGQQFDRDSVGAPRRRSFFYAEDSREYAEGPRDRYDYWSEGGIRERRQILPGTISTPYLQQSSMNW